MKSGETRLNPPVFPTPTVQHRLLVTLNLFLVLILPIVAYGADPGPMALVTNGGSGTVSVIDLSSQSVTNTFTVGTGPVGITAGPLSRFIYVANSGSASISRIDLLTEQVTTLSLPGSIPESIAVRPDGSLIIVTSLESVPVGPGSMGRVYIIDGPSFSVMTTRLVEDDPEGVELSPDGDQAWFASDLKVQEMDLDNDDVLYLVVTDVIDGVEGMDDFEESAVLPDKSRLFVSNQSQDRIEVVSLSTEMIVGTVATGTSPEAVVLRPGSLEVHVTNQVGDSITVFNRTTLAVIGTLNLSQLEPRGLAFTADGSEGYVVMSTSGSVIRYNAATRTEIGSPISVGTLPEEIVIVDTTELFATAASHWQGYR